MTQDLCGHGTGDREGQPTAAGSPHHHELSAFRGADARVVGLVVRERGRHVDVRVGASTVQWSGAHARTPYVVFGAGAEKTVRDWTRAQSNNLKNAIPGSNVLWPAENETG